MMFNKSIIQCSLVSITTSSLWYYISENFPNFYGYSEAKYWDCLIAFKTNKKQAYWKCQKVANSNLRTVKFYFIYVIYVIYVILGFFATPFLRIWELHQSSLTNNTNFNSNSLTSNLLSDCDMQHIKWLIRL